MTEKLVRRKVLKALRHLDAVAIENAIMAGTPDVNYVNGWIEIKWLRKWPENSDTEPVKISHFTPQQRIWLERRTLHNGKAFLLLNVQDSFDWLLFDGEVAAKYVGKITKPELIDIACLHWTGQIDERVLEWL